MKLSEHIAAMQRVIAVHGDIELEFHDAEYGGMHDTFWFGVVSELSREDVITKATAMYATYTPDSFGFGGRVQFEEFSTDDEEGEEHETQND